MFKKFRRLFLRGRARKHLPASSADLSAGGGRRRSRPPVKIFPLSSFILRFFLSFQHGSPALSHPEACAEKFLRVGSGHTFSDMPTRKIFPDMIFFAQSIPENRPSTGIFTGFIHYISSTFHIFLSKKKKFFYFLIIFFFNIMIFIID